MIEKIQKDIQTNLRKYNQELVDIKPQEMLTWGYEKFDNELNFISLNLKINRIV